MTTHLYEVRQTECFGCESDFLRISKGNYFVQQKDAEEVMDTLNEYLEEVREMYKGQLAEKAALLETK